MCGWELPLPMSVFRAGSFASGGSRFCDPCEQGRCLSVAGEANCVDCQGGTYSMGNATACWPCAQGSFSASRASSCQGRSAGTYPTADSGNASSSSCAPCPSRAECDGGEPKPDARDLAGRGRAGRAELVSVSAGLLPGGRRVRGESQAGARQPAVRRVRRGLSPVGRRVHRVRGRGEPRRRAAVPDRAAVSGAGAGVAQAVAAAGQRVQDRRLLCADCGAAGGLAGGGEAPTRWSC